MNFIQIDEEGFFVSGGLRLQDEALCQNLMQNIRVDERRYITDMMGQVAYVEAFDEPYIVKGITSTGELTLPYGAKAQTDFKTLCLDDWDRVHGRTQTGVPFVLSRSAQMQLFDVASEFEDDSITINGIKYNLPTLAERDLQNITREGEPAQSDFWNQSYEDWEGSGQAPGWDLCAPAKPLTEVLPQIKLPKSRICVLGCGAGHDAAHLAAQGHIVTAVDFSPLAIEKARRLYGESSQLKFVEADAFQFAQQHRGEFDIVFEHTFFCAIPPTKRADAVKCWRLLLAEKGHLLAILFVMDRTGGPPFGASEWEIRTRIDKQFHPLYWTRWKTSQPNRLGKELVVYAAKK